MAVASDLPELELERPRAQLAHRRHATARTLGVLTGNQKPRSSCSEDQIAPVMKHAIIAIEDRRFYTNRASTCAASAARCPGRRASRRVQGGSTITQQFVKNALAAQDERTLFQKLREAALAYHLTRKWSKEQILRNYLNTIYFGNGAYGIESAARTYFQPNHPGCDEQRRPDVRVASCARTRRRCSPAWSPRPSALRPGRAPRGRAQARRDLVLQRMLEQGYLTRAQYDDATRAEPLPDAAATCSRPSEDTRATRTSRPGSSSRSSTASAAARRARAGVRGRPARSRRRSTASCRTAGRGARSTHWLPNRDGPARGARRDRQQDRRGARDGRRRRLQRARRSTSPPRASASRARRSSRSSSPRR